MSGLATPFYPPLLAGGRKPTYEELVIEGIEAVKNQDTERWILGYLANQVSRFYGEGSLAQWCSEINLNPKVAYNYAAVQDYFRQPLEELALLCWSHYHLAMRVAKRYEKVTLSIVVAALRAANDNNLGAFPQRGMSVRDFEKWFINALETKGYLQAGTPAKQEAVEPEPVDPQIAEAVADLDQVDLTELEPRASRFIWREKARVVGIEPRANGRYLLRLEVGVAPFDLAAEQEIVIALATIGTIIDDRED